MSSVKFERDSHEWYMFQDYWKLCQKFWIPEDNDEYWEEVLYEAKLFCNKYQSEGMSEKMAIAFIDNLEKKYKARINEKEININGMGRSGT